MELANAMVVRAGWPSLVPKKRADGSNHDRTARSPGDRSPGVRPLADVPSASEDAAVTSAEGASSAPSPNSFLSPNAWVQRSIPAMVFVLLAIALAARVVVLALGVQEIDRETRASLAIVAELSGERLLDRPGLEDVESDPALAQDLLSSVRMPDDERAYILATSTGRLIAETPATSSSASGVHASSEPPVFASHLPQIIVTLTKTGASRIELPDGSVHLAAANRVAILPSGASLVLVVLRDEASLYADWMRDIFFEVVMMTAVAAALFIVLFAHSRQGARARRMEAAQEENDARFHTALLRGRCGMWDWDLARGTMTWSPSMREILGQTRGDDELAAAEVSRMVHAEDLDLIHLGNDALAGNGEAIDRRFRMRCGDGGWTRVRLRAELVLDSNDDPHLIGIAVDVSEQEALERQSERADTRLRDAVESISEAFVLWDARKRLVLWNSKFQQFHAIDGDVLMRGARREDVLAASRQPLSSRKVNAMRETEPGASTEEVEFDDGLWLQVNERRTKDGGVVSVQTDITQIKRNEEKLLQSERSLLTMVTNAEEAQVKLETNAQHLHELADMYKEASEKAELGNRTKSEFMANISHELRTPLNAILGFSDIMTSRMFGPMGSEKYSEYAKDIHDSGMFLLGVINDVLDMSKIEAGRMQLDPEALDLADTIDETLRIIDVQANQKELTVKRSVPGLLSVEADRRAVKQILLNLLSNAVKFTPCDGEIHVKARHENGVVKIAIADTGCGIDADALRRIGVPFEQAQNAFTKNHQGSGLGLAIARSLAELHGGSLDVRSIAGKGTFVLVRLPERQTPAPKEDRRPTQPSTPKVMSAAKVNELAA